SFGRFFIEGLRMDSLYAFSNIRVSQLLSLVMFVAAIVIVIVRRRNPNLKFYNREKQKKKITTS
ncbi:prolipoprotein diacylglyceryl transferase family protein, partial [Enterococcus faecalis]